MPWSLLSPAFESPADTVHWPNPMEDWDQWNPAIEARGQPLRAQSQAEKDGDGSEGQSGNNQYAFNK